MPSTIHSAIPSAIAVLPTPDSPTSNGLFLVLLAKIWIILSISVVLPINLSIFLSATSLLRFIRKSGDVDVFVSSVLFSVLICSSLDGFEGPWDI